MRICEFCGSELPDQASFCGTCGKQPGTASSKETIINSSEDQQRNNLAAVTILSQPDEISSSPTALLKTEGDGAVGSGYTTEFQPDDEEEKRRRALLLGLTVPLVSEAVLEGQPGASAPAIQGTPHLSGAPAVPGTPHLAGAPAVAGRPHLGNPPSQHGTSLPQGGLGGPGILVIPDPTAVIPHIPGQLPLPSSTPYSSPASPPSSTPQPSTPAGCNVWLLMIIVPLLILASIFGIGFTVYAPSLSILINGSNHTNITLGSQFDLFGSNFLPGTSVILTLDGSPLSISNQAKSAPGWQQGQPTQHLQMLASSIERIPAVNNTISAGRDGKFDAKIYVGLDWSLGVHTLQAAESLSPRTARVALTIYSAREQPTPQSHLTATAKATGTPTVTPTTTATVTTGTNLSTVMPNIVNLGPIGEGSNQLVSAKVTLATTGNGLVAWSATWNHSQFAWLQLSQTAGQLQAPASQQLTVSASTQNGQIKAGTYTTTITFSSTASKQVLGLSVSFTVEPGCVAVTPGTLNFTGIAGISDPNSQTLTLTNCAQQAGSWSESMADPKANWLHVNPTSDMLLNGGDSDSVTVSATNIEAKLAVGIYQNTLQFSNGSSQVNVKVTLTVQEGPTLSVNNPVLTDTQGCTFTANNTGLPEYVCTESLTSSATPAVNVNWSAGSTGVAGITFTDGQGIALNNGTLKPGQTVRIVIHIPRNNCQTATSISFQGPANTVTVPWSCTIIG